MKVMEAAAAFLDEMEIPYEINCLVGAPGARNGRRFRQERSPERYPSDYRRSRRSGPPARRDSRPYAGSRNRRADQVVQLDRRLGQYPVDFADALGYSRGDHGAGRARNAAILAVQILAAGDEALMRKLIAFKQDLARKIERANEELSQVSRPFKTN